MYISATRLVINKLEIKYLIRKRYNSWNISKEIV